jgi:hypothetical protein
MGETQTEVGKILGLGHMGDHWDGKGPLKDRLEDEIADTIAAQQFVIEKNGLDFRRIKRRAKQKCQKFNRWHENIQAGRDPNDDG